MEEFEEENDVNLKTHSFIQNRCFLVILILDLSLCRQDLTSCPWFVPRYGKFTYINDAFSSLFISPVFLGCVISVSYNFVHYMFWETIPRNVLSYQL